MIKKIHGRPVNLFLVLLTFTLCVQAQEYGIVASIDHENILPLWEQAKFMETQLKWRQKHVLQEVMRREGVDLWLVGRNEYVLYLSLIPGDQEGLVSDRPDYFIFHDRGKQEGARLILGDFDDLAEVVDKCGPHKIGVGDRNKRRIEEALGNRCISRMIDLRNLRTGFIEKRSPLFLMRYSRNGRFDDNTRYGAGPYLSSEESRRSGYPVYLKTASNI